MHVLCIEMDEPKNGVEGEASLRKHCSIACRRLVRTRIRML